MAHTHRTHPLHRRAPLAAALLATAPCWAQTASLPETRLAPVVVTGQATPAASIGGWGDVPLSLTPLQANVIGTAQMRERGAQRLADLTGLDPSVSDAYNTEGYWDYLTVRGFVLDNRFNFRRDGLPISAETFIALDNKAQVEIMKGTSGMQAGTSAPGGLVNYVVKRPLATPLRSISIEAREAGSVTAAADLSQRFGAAEAFGLRLNAAAAHLDPKVHDAKGDRHLLALAGDWRVSGDTLLEAEVEISRRSQPSVPGFSLLGNSVPAPVDPRINLNNQSWSLPVVLEGQTASLRWQQRLSNDWQLVTHFATQRLRSDDRIAFPFGCTDPNPPPDGTYYADRYCPNGNFDLYDFRSENERRRTDALDVHVQGKLQLAGMAHQITLGLLRSQVRNRFQAQAYNFSGTGNVDGSVRDLPAAPDANDPNTNRDELSNELYLRDAVTLTPDLTAWAGLRATRLHRRSVRTDGSEASDYRKSFGTPFVALSYALAPRRIVYASWGQGIESEVAPSRDRYDNRGEALAPLKSRQVELGAKGNEANVVWSATLFEIRRPQSASIENIPGGCDTDETVGGCTLRFDGEARHRGLELSSDVDLGAWTVGASALWLQARREGASDAAQNGKRPPNVPAHTFKAQARYRVPGSPGTELSAALAHEGNRTLLPDDDGLRIPSWTRIDLGVQHRMQLADTRLTWRAGVDNLFDRRAWRESPFQFEHVYLFPLAPRTLRVSLQADL